MKILLPSLFLLLTSGWLFSDEWGALASRFEAAQEHYEKSSESASKEKAEEAAIAYLRSLLLYESATRALMEPQVRVTGLEKIREFSSQERRQIQKLRQEIRDAERELIIEALASDSDLAGDQKGSESLLKDELRLDGFFLKNTRKLSSEISKLERELGKLQQKSRRDDPRWEQLKTEIEELKHQVSEIHRALFGYSFGAGFREPADESLPGEPRDLLQSLVAERERIFALLKGEQAEGGEKEGKAATVGGSFLYSSNLGVVLDVSGSMTPHLEELRDEINSYFESPRYREVEGCRLDSCHFESHRTKRRASTWATMSMMEELITIHEVDTIYWFSDLKDDQDAMSVRRLRELLKRGGTRLHVKSLGEKPSRELDDLIADFQD